MLAAHFFIKQVDGHASHRYHIGSDISNANTGVQHEARVSQVLRVEADFEE